MEFYIKKYISVKTQYNKIIGWSKSSLVKFSYLESIIMDKISL